VIEGVWLRGVSHVWYRGDFVIEGVWLRGVSLYLSPNVLNLYRVNGTIS